MNGADPAVTGAKNWQRLIELFHAVAELPAVERAAVLDREYASEPAMRRELESLLAVYDEAPGFLESLASRRPSAPAALQPETPMGALIGPYRLVRRIGSGGMGAVYLAERADEQFRKLVALKLVHAGLSSDEILRRFRAERQILAALDHPNIARLLDGGRTDDGRPYLVMEYVEDAAPIDEHCDRHSLPIASRLRLFLTVCDAVRYAHRNLIVHRDLKPSNIMVSGSGAVKLLDFGIAKLLDSENLGVTAPGTRTGARLMTPEYASPEQVRAEPITTASDVYSLGVLLGKLLSGRLPYHLKGSSIEEMVRAICHEEPEKPSAAVSRTETRRLEAELLSKRLARSRAGELSEDGDEPRSDAADPGGTALDPSVAVSRGGMGGSVLPALRGRATERRLARELRGDLDNIVLTALRKNPRERYQSVDALAEDVLRHLEHRPILARRETAGYVLRKFVRRHRMGVAAASVVAVSLLAGLAGVVWQAELVRVERDRARLEARKAEQVSGLLLELFDSSDPTKEVRADQMTVREVLERGEKKVLERLGGQAEVQATMLHVLGRAYAKLALFNRASELLEAAAEKRRALHGRMHPDVAESLHELSGVLVVMERPEAAERAAREALSVRTVLYGDRHPLVAQSLVQMAHISAVRNESGVEQSEDLFRQALAIEVRAFGAESVEAARTTERLAEYLFSRSRYTEAEQLYVQAMNLYRKHLGEDHLEVARVTESLSVALGERGEYDEAARLRGKALDIRRKWLGDEHPELAESYTNLGTTLYARGDYDAALGPLRRALELWRKGGSGGVSLALSNLGVVLTAKGDYTEAEAMLREALALRIKAHGEGNGAVAHVQLNLAAALAGQQRLAESEQLLRTALATWRQIGTDHLVEARTHGEMGRVLLALSRLEEARQSLDESIRLFRGIFPTGHPELARPLVTLGELLLRQGLAEQAEAAAREAIDLRQAKLPSDHWQIAQARSLLGASLAAQSRHAEARPLLISSQEALRTKLGPEHLVTQQASRWLAELAGSDAPHPEAAHVSGAERAASTGATKP